MNIILAITVLLHIDWNSIAVDDLVSRLPMEQQTIKQETKISSHVIDNKDLLG